jgi:hypothetical protein
MACAIALALALAFSLASAGPESIAAEASVAVVPADEVLFQSPRVRIYRALDRHGRPTIVLTNLDENGEPLDPEEEERPVPSVQRPHVSPGAASAPGRAANAGEGRRGGAPVKVAIRPGDGEERAAGEDEIEVRNDDGGGTTIVININNNPPPPPAPAPPPAPPPPPPAVVTVPVLGYGGIVGPFRYPEHHHFLGYGHGVRSPSSFSALGLRVSDRFLTPEAEEP